MKTTLRSLWVFACLAMLSTTGMFGQTPVFSDDFNRASLSPGGTPAMTYTNTVATGVTVSTNSSTFLRIASSTTAGFSYVTGSTTSFASPYNPVLSSNTAKITWTFNFRWNRASSNNPAAPASGAYGQAIVLASSGPAFNTGTTGYAIVYGSSGTPDPIRLVRFSNGLTTLTDVISAASNNLANTNNYASVRVTYDPSTNTWALFLRDDGATAWSDPTTGVTTQIGTDTVNNTYTSTALNNFGFVYSHAAGVFSGDFDNFRVAMASANAVPTATAVQFTGTLQVNSLLTGTYTYNDAEGDAQGTSTYKWYRADDNAGLNEAAIVGATGTTYTLAAADSGKYIRFSVRPIAATGSTNGTETFSAYQGPITTNVNSLSTITVDPSLTPTQNVNYSAFTGTDVLGTSYELGRFLLNDVAGTPDDGLVTKLTALTLSLSNAANLEKVALYDDSNNEIQELTASGTLSFTGLNIQAASGASKSFSIRVTFKTAVTDNDQPQLTITNATADPAGSFFTAANAGGAASSVAADNNRIEVTASKLAFLSNAVTSVVNVAMTPSVTVRALDANNNLDKDYTAAVDITSTGVLSVSPTSVNAVAGLATFASIIHTQTANARQLTAASGALTVATSALFDIYNPIFANTITGTNPNLSNPYTTGQFTDANLTASGIGRGSGIVGTNANDRYNANGWNVAGFDANKYFEFIITPNPSKEIDFANLVYTAQISSTGALSNYEIRSSVDGFAAAIGSPTAAASPGALVNIDLSAPQFQNIAAPITFRIYGWGAASGTATYSINNFSFNGQVTNSTAPLVTVSTPSISNLDYFQNAGPSASQSFLVNAANLNPSNDNLTVSATTGFEVSTDNVTFQPSVLLAYVSGTITNAPVYVRAEAGLSLGTHTGTVTVSGGTAANATVSVQSIVRVPFGIPYANSFRTQILHNDAVAQGFTFNNTVFNAGGYEQLSLNGYIETPIIDFTQQSTVQISFGAATFGGNAGQTLQLQVSTDGGANYSLLTSVTATSSTVYNTVKYNVDLSTFGSTNGRLRIQMTGGANTTRFRDFYILNTTIWDGTAWSNGTPAANVVATIQGNYSTTANGALTAKSLTVDSGIVAINTGDTLHLEDELTVNGGSLGFENNANLIQVNTATNTGNITIERDALMKRQDYVYWSSPVSGQFLLPFSPETLTNRFYTLNEATNAFVSVDPTLTSFAAAKGYMVRAPNTFTTTNQTFVGLFTGVPRNGTISIAATKDNLGYNMIGNPYPSPVNANSFLSANPSVGTLYFWAHVQQGAASGANYATYNGTGAASALGGATPNGTIQTGQGFMINVPAATTITFNNAMRVDNHQNQFFRNANEGTVTEKNRLWLNLTSPSTAFNQILVGYVEGATNAIDVAFDGKMLETANSSLYNLIDNAAYTIQGKSLPFNAADVVALGFKANEAGSYTITLDHFDGVFAAGQDIFLQDALTGTVHNLKTGAYTFASQSGTFNERFKVVYQNTTLGVQNPVLEAAGLVIFKQNQALNINAGTVMMKNIKIFDIRGRLVFEKDNLNSASEVVNLNVAQQVLVVQVTAQDNKTISKKVVY